MFDPKCRKFPYPEQTDKHYLIVKKDRGIVFDENYPYVDTSKSFLRKQKWLRFMLYFIVFLVSRIRMGLRVKGRENIKNNKELLKNGAVSICNHVHMFDYLSIMYAIRPFKTYLLSWDKNVNGESGPLVRLVGGIPIPENNMQATISFLKATENMLDKGGWLHIYPEGSMWEFYAPIRPFKSGASYFACKCNKPIIPLAYSYRKPGWLRKYIFRQVACFNLAIGQPLFPNESLPLHEREIDLTIRAHEEVCRLSGINPKENIYQPIFNNSKRIDYYVGELGKGYKGSK